MSALLEALTLLSHEGANGRAGAYLDLGLGGAVLYELALADRIGLEGKKVRVLDPSPTVFPDRRTRPSRKALKAFAEAHWVGAATRRAVGNRDGATAAGSVG